MAKEAVNGWFADLVSSAAEPVFGLLGDTVLGTPELDSPGMVRAKELWGVSQTIANTCFVLLLTAGGVWLMAGHSMPGAELTPGQLTVRVVGAFLASNLSLILIGHGISFANGLATAFLNAGAESIDPSVVADVVAGFVAASLVPGQPFTAIVALAVVVLALCVAFIYIMRLALTMVLIAAAPVALMFHALPMTDGLARLWWRGITGVLAIQVCQSLVLATAVRLMFTETGDASDELLGLPSSNDVTDLLLAACLLWVMLRIPSWVARTIWRQAQPRALGGLLRSLILYRGLGALMGNRRRGTAPVRRGFQQGPSLSPSPSPSPAAPPRRPQLLGASRPPLALPAGPPPPRPSPPHPMPPRRFHIAGPPRPPLALPAGPPPPEPADPDADSKADREGGRRPMQLPLPIPNPSARPANRRPAQLALPIPATRVPRPSASGTPAPPSARPRGRSGQLMLPGMPRRPVPHRQLTLWIEPPKNRRRAK